MKVGESWGDRAHKGRVRVKFANSKIEARSVEHGKLLPPCIFCYYGASGHWPIIGSMAQWQSRGGNVSWITFPFWDQILLTLYVESFYSFQSTFTMLPILHFIVILGSTCFQSSTIVNIHEWVKPLCCKKHFAELEDARWLDSLSCADFLDWPAAFHGRRSWCQNILLSCEECNSRSFHQISVVLQKHSAELGQLSDPDLLPRNLLVVISHSSQNLEWA